MILTNKETTLKKEYDDFKEKMSHKESSKLKEKLYSDFTTEYIPLEIQMELVRDRLNIAPHIWKTYSNIEKGRLIAIDSISNKIETLSRFYDEIRSSKKGK